MYYTTIFLDDGFGSQYQKIIETFIYCKIHNMNFLYTPFTNIAHNYNNDLNFINNIENLINLKDNIPNVNHNEFKRLHYGDIVMKFCNNNIDFFYENKYLDFIKNCFWLNKNKNKYVFNNNKINIAIHIRRGDVNHLINKDRYLPNEYYLKVINIIKNKYKDRKLLFHIYSEGIINDFDMFINEDTLLHINKDLCESFIEMVSADIFVMSKSSLSYSVALLSDSSEIYYKKFWHNPRKNWITVE